MNNYFKNLSQDNIKYNDGLKKGVKVYEGVPDDENLFKLDKLIFKNGDLMAEIPQQEFPFELKKDTCFSVVSVKGKAANYVVELEAPQTYFIKYFVKDYTVNFIASYNEVLEKSAVSILMTDSLKRLFKVEVEKGEEKDSEGVFQPFERLKGEGAKFLNQLTDITGTNVSKMISIISNDDYNLQHETKHNFTIRTKNSIKNIGKPTLVTTRHRNMIHICDAYPYFYDVDFKKMLADNPIVEGGN